METETWDVFISHASEDKEEIARPMYDMLHNFGLTVWYDESEIECGDNILEKISYGLENTNYFIILLSPDFIRKVWTDAENEGIGYIRTVNKKRVIPIYHNLIVDDLNHKFLYLKFIDSFYTDKETMLDYSTKIVKKILEFNLQNILDKEIDIDELIEISLKYISSLNTTRDKIKKAEDTKKVIKFLYKLDCDFIPILEEIVDRKKIDHSNIGNYIKLLKSKHDSCFNQNTNQILKTNSLPSDQNHYITIELEPVDNNNFKVVILEESENNKYLEVKFSDDNDYTRNEIVTIVDKFIEDNYEDITADIYLIFVLPSNLMSEDIDFWKLEEDRTLGDDYTILLRGRERFRKEGIFSRKKLYTDWKSAWTNCKKKHNKEICSVLHQIECGQEKLHINRVKDTPFIILDYNPSEKNLKDLYRSHVSIMMWANNCRDKSKFSKLIEKHQHKKLGEIHTKLYEFKPNETGLDANIMLLYDDPYKLPHDVNAPRFEVPQ